MIIAIGKFVIYILLSEHVRAIRRFFFFNILCSGGKKLKMYQALSEFLVIIDTLNILCTNEPELDY